MVYNEEYSIYLMYLNLMIFSFTFLSMVYLELSIKKEQYRFETAILPASTTGFGGSDVIP